MGPCAWPSLKQTFVSLDVHEPPAEPPLPLPPLPLPPVPGLVLLFEEPQETAEATAPAKAKAINRAETVTNLDEVMLIPSNVCSFN